MDIKNGLIDAGFSNNEGSCYYEYLKETEEYSLRIGIHIYPNYYRFSAIRKVKLKSLNFKYSDERCVMKVDESELRCLLLHFGIKFNGIQKQL